MKLINTTSRDLGLDPETVIPAGGALEIDEKDAEKFEGSPVVAGWLKAGDLAVAKLEKAKQPAKAKTKKRSALESQAEKLAIKFSDETADEQLIADIKAAKAKG